MTLPRFAAFAAAALSLAGCAHGPTKPQASASVSGPALAQETPPAAEAQAQTPPQAAPPVYDAAARPAARNPSVALGQVYAAPAPAPLHDVPAPRRAPIHDAPQRQAAAPAPIYQPAPQRQAAAPAPAAPAPRYDLGPVYAAPAPAPIYAPPAPAESYVAAGPRRLGEMAPVRDREDGASGRSRSGGGAVPGPRRYATADGDLSAPGPEDLRRVASLGPVSAPRRSFGFDSGLGSRLVEAARAQTRSPVRYDGAYVKISYPWGDVPGDTGVCTDVIVRAYRQLGFDFQQLMHEDMREAFAYYPSAEIYGLKEPDPNIDHRRVVNMEAFLERHAQRMTPTRNPGDYQPGDIVSWRISGTQPHIGIISDKRDDRSGTPYVIHNIGAGVKEENMLFLSPPVGHYRFAPSSGSGPVRTAGL